MIDIATSSTITLTAPGTAPLTLNSVDWAGVRWTVRQFEGWGSPGSSISVVQKPRQAGGWAGAAYTQPRYLRVGVRIVAPTPDLLTLSLDTLYDAISLSGATLTVDETGYSRSLTVRRSDEVQHTRVTNLIADVQFQVVAVDPRKLGVTQTGQTALPSTTGGLTIPFTIPFTIDSVVVSGLVNLGNPGNTAGPVVLRIDGPCAGPVVTHTSSSTSNALVFSSNITLGAGEYLLVDMDKRTVLANGQSTRAGTVTSRGWSAFDPGSNTWSFTSAVYNAAAMLTVQATPAWK